MRDPRSDFPQLERHIDGRRAIYLDSAATALKPKQVVEAITGYYTHYTANVARGNHALTEEVTNAFEDSRATIARHIGADPFDCVFTMNTTDSINTIVGGIGMQKSDRVLATISEHHSNYVPWLRAATVDPIPIDSEGFIDPDQVRKMLEKPARLVTIGHASNVTGAVQQVRAIADICHERGVPLVVDGAQAAPHLRVDVNELGCDFYAFSGHKMLGPTGIGVLWARPEILEKMEPSRVGGGVIYRVFWDRYTLRDLPLRLEAGTPHIAGAIGLAAAVRYLDELGMEEVEKHERKLAAHLLERFSSMEGVRFIGPKTADRRLGLLSIHFDKARADEVGIMLSERYGVLCRSGVHCAQPLFDSMGCLSAVRASTYVYSTVEDIDALAKGIDELVNRRN